MDDDLQIGILYRHYVTDEIFVEGNVIYNDGVTAIIKVTDRYMEGYSEVLRYNEVRDYIPEFQDPESKRLSEYLCLDVESGWNLFQRDLDDNSVKVLVEEENGDITPTTMKPYMFRMLRSKKYLEYEFSNREIIKQQDSAQTDTCINIDLYCPVPNKILNETGNNQDSSEEDLHYSLNRSVHWLGNRNCAILTAWRGNYSRKENQERNHELQESLRANGYGVIRVKGCYAEIGRAIEKEDSFLVFDQTDSDDFLQQIYQLSEHYEQDCFLIKPADEKIAYLIGTNDSYGKLRISIAGVLHINSVEATNFSKVGSGTISFKKK